MTRSGIPVLDDARRILAAIDAAAVDLSSLPMRWTIRTDAFDCWRQRMEDMGHLITACDDLPPRLFGIPYDLGWPARGAMVTLEIAPPEPCVGTPFFIRAADPPNSDVGIPTE